MDLAKCYECVWHCDFTDKKFFILNQISKNVNFASAFFFFFFKKKRDLKM